MNVPLLFITSAMAVAGLAAAAYVVTRTESPHDPAVLALAREIRALESTRPEPLAPREQDAPSRSWTRDERDAGFTAPPVVAEIAWFADGAAYGVGRCLARGPQAVRLGRPEDAVHFWYLRNPVDLARMDGVEVRHEERALVEYPETDLQDVGLGASWATLCQFGVAPDEFAALVRSGAIERAFALEFERWTRRPASPAAEGDVLELWWNEPFRLPLRVVRLHDGKTLEQRLIALEPRADLSLERVPALHWPAYQVMDVADYREGLHEHGAAAPGGAPAAAHEGHAHD